MQISARRGGYFCIEQPISRRRSCRELPLTTFTTKSSTQSQHRFPARHCCPPRQIPPPAPQRHGRSTAAMAGSALLLSWGFCATSHHLRAEALEWRARGRASPGWEKSTHSNKVAIWLPAPICCSWRAPKASLATGSIMG